MRLKILENGHSFGTKLLFRVIRVLTRQPVLDVVRVAKHRPDFYGNAMGELTQEVMRGPSTWSIAERELMAAVVAKANHSAFCTSAHSEVAQQAYGDEKNVSSILMDPTLEKVEEPLRSTLLVLIKLTHDNTVSADDMQRLLALGTSRQQIEDALAVCFSFSVMGRLDNAFGFSIPDRRGIALGAKYLLHRGYR